MLNLSGVKILITRPLIQAEGLAAELKNLGAIPTLFPTLEIRPVLHAELESYNFANINKLIFISQNAVIHSVGLNPEYWQAMPQQCQIISMGSGTTAVLHQYGIRVDVELAPGGTSETLLNLPELNNITAQQILVIAGAGGRELLIDTLEQRGAIVEKLVVYHRSKPKKIMPKWKEDFDIVLCTSGESLQNFKAMLLESGQAHLLTAPLLVISQRMLKLSKELGFTGDIWVTQGASNAAIIESLQQWNG